MTGPMILTINMIGIGLEANGDSPLFGRFAHGNYAYEAGLPNLLDALTRLEVRATIFWPSSEAARAPELLRRCVAEGHEIACLGHAFENHATLERAEEKQVLRVAFDTLEQTAGTRPVGFRSPSRGLSKHTMETIASLGVRYDSSYVDDDQPHWLNADLIEVPWSQTLADVTHFGRRATLQRARLLMMEECEALLEDGGWPCVTLHPRADMGMGRLARLEILDEMVGLVRAGGGRVVTCREASATVVDQAQQRRAVS